jgi:hypothetical protein
MKGLVAVMCVLLVTIAAFGSTKDSDCGCDLPATASNRAVEAIEAIEAVQAAKGCDNEEPDLQESVAGEPLEWQCIIVDIIIGDCIDWDSGPCPNWTDTCSALCATACTAPICYNYPSGCTFAGIGCSWGCSKICKYIAPTCTYCVEYDITIIESCGWVFTE